HAVEAFAEEADLVLSFRGRQPPLQVPRARDRVGGLDDRFERPQRPPGDQPAGHECCQQCWDRRDDQEAEDAPAVGRLDAGWLAGGLAIAACASAARCLRASSWVGPWLLVASR